MIVTCPKCFSKVELEYNGTSSNGEQIVYEFSKHCRLCGTKLSIDVPFPKDIEKAKGI
ncbi:MAG TPA: hypothetical protein PLR64_03425 [Candidatus Dojkabacteria bacterium]|nr:hypothetical protein [Candidatus Dojkabacteria bacterium]